MTTVHFVRHGETVWHHENRYAGRTDVELTDRGRAQAVDLARWAATEAIDRVLSSDLRRAAETARLAADALGLPLVTDPRLREVDFGQAEGMTSAEMSAAFPDARREFEARPATHPLPGGERGADAVARAIGALAELPANSTALVVAHTTLGRLLLCHLLGLPLDDYRRAFPSVGNGTVTTFELPSVARGAGGSRNRSADLAGRAALLRFNERVCR